jgi:hypothetical protein
LLASKYLNDLLQFCTKRIVLYENSDGITACGLFVVLSYIIEKYKKELEIDVCNGIRIARRSGREFVNNAVRKYKLLTLCVKSNI